MKLVIKKKKKMVRVVKTTDKELSRLLLKHVYQRDARNWSPDVNKPMDILAVWDTFINFRQKDVAVVMTEIYPMDERPHYSVSLSSPNGFRVFAGGHHRGRVMAAVMLRYKGIEVEI